jgi:hypothetical protein
MKLTSTCAAVDVAIEIQQVDFQHRLEALGHGRPHADVGGAGQRLRVDAGNRDGEYAGQRQALAPDLDVGGGKADGAAELLAVHDAAGDDEGAPQQLLGVLDVAGGERLAHRGAGNPMPPKSTVCIASTAKPCSCPAAAAGRNRRRVPCRSGSRRR